MTNIRFKRNYYIKPEFQNRFIAKFWMMLVLSSLMLAVCIYLFSTSSLTTTFDNSRLVIKSTADFILPILLFSGCLIILSVSTAAIYITKRSSHSLAGPIHRFEQELKKIKAGDMSGQIQLRKDDQFKELAAELNETVLAIRGRIAAARTELEKINTRDCPSPEIAATVKSALETLQYFKTDNGGR